MARLIPSMFRGTGRFGTNFVKPDFQAVSSDKRFEAVLAALGGEPRRARPDGLPRRKSFRRRRRLHDDQEDGKAAS